MNGILTADSDRLRLPEHEKLREIQPLSQAVYNFLVWCDEQGMALSLPHGESGYHLPITEGREKLLARHFGIDLNKLEREKEAILAEQRALNERKDAR